MSVGVCGAVSVGACGAVSVGACGAMSVAGASDHDAPFPTIIVLLCCFLAQLLDH